MKRFLTIAILLLLCYPVFAALSLSALFSDHLVLQRGVDVPVWGTAAPKEEVTVKLAGQSVSTVTGDDGTWKVVLAPLKVTKDGEALTMTVSGTTEIVVNDILVGEVWLCSGQSNMELSVRDALNSQEEIAKSTDPQIRMFTVGHAGVAQPQNSCKGTWAPSSPDTVGAFSAVGYYFARELRARLKVPVGIINASWGGSPIQPWIPMSAVSTIPPLTTVTDTAKEWERAYFDDDFGLREKWFAPTTDTHEWQSFVIPMPDVASSLNYMGSIWFRRDVEVPTAWVGKKLQLNLGAIDDVDVTYVNGQLLAQTLYDIPDGWRTPRHYAVPDTLITSTKVTVVVRALNRVFTMGLMGKSTDYSLTLADDSTATPLSLAGTWQGRVGSEVDMTRQPMTFGYGSFYNGMIHPLAGFALRGFLWYQGETNANQPDSYAQLFPVLISSWRQAWKQDDMPFYFVQLAGFCARQRDPIEHYSWAEVRDAQAMALTIPHTGMAVATDIGDAADIHPRNKQEVGRRLALWALARDYRQRIECSGPLYTSMKIRKDKILLKFDHASKLHPSSGAQIIGFAIAGEDKIFHWAEAKVTGKSLTVWSPEVVNPVAVRYGWAFLPIGNLVNAADLPAAPFRTDNWPASESGVAR